MTNNIIQVDYRQLDNIAQRFEQQAEHVEKLRRAIQETLDGLKRGGWIGENATRFQADMANDVMPAINRLRDGLYQARETVHQIKNVYRQGEENAAAMLRGSISSTRLDGLKIPGAPSNLPIPIAPVQLGYKDDLLNPGDYVVTPQEFRQYVADAAKYHDVPPELLAAILQQENYPNAEMWKKWGQVGERFIQRELADVADLADDLGIIDKEALLQKGSPYRSIASGVIDGSVGISNMKPTTAQGAADYIQRVYQRSVMPENVADTAVPFLRRDNGPGRDVVGDLYYTSAHLRELIDRVKGSSYQGVLTREDIAKIGTAYNGGSQYGQDMVNMLDRASRGEVPLYFYGGQ